MGGEIGGPAGVDHPQGEGKIAEEEGDIQETERSCVMEEVAKEEVVVGAIGGQRGEETEKRREVETTGGEAHRQSPVIKVG